MAAAYLYHITQDHPFVDGNKCTATVATFQFLRQNGIELKLSESEIVDLVLAVAQGKVRLDEIEDFLRLHQAPPASPPPAANP